MMPRRLFTLLMLLTLSLSFTAAQSNDPEILWDVWGVPHIFSPDDEGVFYAFGWAQAQNQGDLILKLYGEARGRAAEYWGEDFLASDAKIRTLNIPQQGIDSYSAQDATWKANLDAFAAGVNAYAAAHPDKIDDSREVVLPVSGADVMAHGIRVLRYEFVARAGVNIARGWGDFLEGMGSNAWAIAPSKSASGNAMLVSNTHQPWFEFGLWMEAHLISPNVDVYGAALVGNPVLGVGFNANLGWTHTVNTHDGWDLYQLSLSEDGLSYQFDGEMRPFDLREEAILVKQADGTFSEQMLSVKTSIHGPILAEREDGTALALRVVGDEAYFVAKQWWDMGAASSLAEFEAALSRLQIPMFTVMYADREGNILHVFNELVPVRQTGDWAFWNNLTLLDNANPAIIPGDSSDYVWNEYHPYEDLPRVLNPESGWLQNANEPPWTTTYPLALDPADYPAYMVPPSYIWPRPLSSIELLMENESITFEKLIELKHSTHAELADRILPDLLAVTLESDDELSRRAAEILQAWDGDMGNESVGAVLFTLWIAGYVGAEGTDIFARQWDINDPLNTPSGLKNPEKAAEYLRSAASQLELLRAVGGEMDVPYGDVFRLRVGEYDLPANGGTDLVGTFRVLNFRQDPDLRFSAVHGDSFIAIIEFGEEVRAKVLLAYGNATQPGSPHVGDQLPLFSEKLLRDAWLTREEVEANLEKRETLTR